MRMFSIADSREEMPETELSPETIQAGIEENYYWTCEAKQTPSDDWKLEVVLLALYAARPNKFLQFL